MSKILVKGDFLLEKFPGKGGWTYAALPSVKNHKNNPFGWLKVKGNIEGYKIQKYHLMPMGNANLFLPVKSEIRKKKNKSAGDYINITLYIDDDPVEIPQEFMDCLKEEAKAKEFFNNISDDQKERIIKWIYSVKSDEKRAERILLVLKKLNDAKIGW